MSSSVKELPKIESTLKGELLSPHHLKETKVSEKNVLPTESDIAQEKTHQGLIQGVETFTPEKLHHVKTREPASGVEVMRTELAHQSSVKEVTSFDKTGLKHTETQEKNSLPDKDAIAAEAEHNQFKAGIEKFDKEKLAHADTVEKNTLPTKEVIDQEKAA